MTDHNRVAVDTLPRSDTPNDLLRTSRVFERPESRRPQGGTPDDIRTWLQGPARRIEDTLELVDELSWRLVGAGIRLSRVVISLPTLHPQYLNTGYRWFRVQGFCEERQLSHGIRDSAMFLNSPMHRVFVHGETVRRRLIGKKPQIDFPILQELADEGVTDYIALPLELSDGRRFAVTLATDQEDGFSRANLATLGSLIGLLAPLLEIHVMRGDRKSTRLNSSH
mgnify:FL=1